MKMTKKKVAVTLALTASLTYTSVLPAVTYASPSLQQINKDRSAQQSLSADLSAQQQALQSDLKTMISKQLKLTGEISQSQVDINQNNDAITALNSEIGTIQKRIDNRKKLLDERLVSIYKSGGSINYIDVLLGSKNFGDFLDRTKALFTITSQDQKLITDQQNDQSAVNDKKQIVEKKQATNVAKLENLKSALNEVEALQAQRKIAIDALSVKQKSVQQQLTALAGAAADIAKAAQNVTPTSYSPSTVFASRQSGASSSNSSSSSNSGSSNSSSSSNSGSSQSAAPSASSFNISASAATGGISGIVNYGNQFIGRSSYVWGASDPSTGQFDCSGFVRAAFAANGISLHGNTDSLVNMGTPVSYSQAKPGDLIFFDTYQTNGHVGIYLGGGRFIGSQDSTGVAVVSMSNPYWSSHFSGVVRRILN
ncbi:C40 family peptidase [Sporolactobacillus pectinivorans]|uniref:C40 family peptidase n=1 Tax=Sporolactobacillus pectinivorans TaxID=1591408 RepID=UPI000C2619A6|nr:C40 family peptidase [Sporolactobacillus pectinivorans]